MGMSRKDGDNSTAEADAEWPHFRSHVRTSSGTVLLLLRPGSRPSLARVSLTRFLGQKLPAALSSFDASHLLAPWAGCRPTERRPRMPFAPVFFDEDHSHPHAELCLLLDGRCRFSFDHSGCVLRAGDLVALPGDLPHAEGYCRPGEAYQLAWWILDPKEPGLHVTRYEAGDGFVLDHLLPLALLTGEARDRLDFLRAMVMAADPPEIEPVREALYTITFALYRQVLEHGEGRLDSRTQLVRRAIEYVRAHAAEPLTLSAVARAVRVSPNYLTGLFRVQTGMPLGRFVLTERIAVAQQRLREPGASVKSVGLDLGFADPFTFSRAFKRVTGQPPRTWIEVERSSRQPALS